MIDRHRLDMERILNNDLDCFELTMNLESEKIEEITKKICPNPRTIDDFVILHMVDRTTGEDVSFIKLSYLEIVRKLIIKEMYDYTQNSDQRLYLEDAKSIVNRVFNELNRDEVVIN